MLRVVELSNGMYAVQKKKFPRRFIDLTNRNFTWGIGSEFFKDCQKDKETCVQYVKDRELRIVGYASNS